MAASNTREDMLLDEPSGREDGRIFTSYSPLKNYNLCREVIHQKFFEPP